MTDSGKMGASLNTGVHYMPKIVDYPRNSLRRAVSLAEAVDKLGGEASDEMAAEGIGQKIGGTFRALVSSAGKYGFVDYTRGRIKTLPLFQDYKLAYSEQQKQEALRKAFLSVPLFKALVERLSGQAVPGHMEKLLVREYDVPDDLVSRIREYFIEGARETGVLGSNGIIQGSVSMNTTITPGTGSLTINSADPDIDVDLSDHIGELPEPQSVPQSFMRYSVRIFGPGIDTKISIKDEEDLDIVEVTLKKVRRLLKAEQEKQSAG